MNNDKYIPPTATTVAAANNEQLRRAHLLAAAVHGYLYGRRTDVQRSLVAEALRDYLGQVPDED